MVCKGQIEARVRNFRPKRANFRPERLDRGTIKLMNEQTEEQISVIFYRTLSPSELLPKKLKNCY